MDVDVKVSRVLKSKVWAGITPSCKQLEQIRKVAEYFRDNGEAVLKQQAVWALLARMVSAGVDTLFVRRLLRKRKYCHRGVTLYALVITYGRLGLSKWNDYVKAQSVTNTFEYKRGKYGWTLEQFNEFNNSRAITEINLKKKYGEVEGRDRFASYCNLQRDAGCTKEYFIKKYGADKGKEKYEAVNASKALTVDNLMKKHSCSFEDAVDILGGYRYRSHASAISQEFAWAVYNKLNAELQAECYFSDLNKEFGKFDIENRRYVYYDFALSHKKIIIEYNGDFYHACPDKYAPDDIIKYGNKELLASDIWAADAHKNKIVQDEGYHVIVVWDNEYLANKDGTINRIVEEIYDRVY
ncbi:hypothetical protein Aes508_035 [Aeromonas phage Aes508]|uniref:VSR endonuclease n=3 Tax=Straboviridae TaxID=2946170 RepID=J7KI64_9CAUD|nr:hypothetical protein F484_gp034 [Aeromonas phage Aes508]AFN69917.1 putative VSR endonuclease [Aeromonas phage Aes512]AFN69926.1 putative VSR endonuclease [Aeromonas phage Aes517]AFQ97117.1 hypothetical protein Aes508_035 [Aeromonas phage Aes508]